MGGLVVPTVFFTQPSVSEELFTEVRCQHLGVFQRHFADELIRKAICGSQRVVGSSEEVHGGLSERLYYTQKNPEVNPRVVPDQRP